MGMPTERGKFFNTDRGYRFIAPNDGGSDVLCISTTSRSGPATASVERVLRPHSKPLSHLTGNRRPPADRRIRPRHRKQVANPTNLPQVLHHFAEWKHLGSKVIDVIQDVPREVCGERVDILAALGESNWVKLKEDRWGLGAGQQVGCATQDSRFAAFRVDLGKIWPTPDECTERIERNCVRPRQPMVRTSA